MKKILIPTLLTLTTTPFISMVSCKQKEPEPEPEPEHDYSKDCLTITALEDCQCGFTNYRDDPNVNYLPDLYYSVDDTETKKYNFEDGTLGDVIELSQGSSVKFWGNNPEGFSFYDGNGLNIRNTFQASGKFSVLGNIMSIIDNGSCQLNQIPNSGCFIDFLCQNWKLVDASNLILPTGLTNYCFYRMFTADYQLATPPKLKATKLAKYCYASMFQVCRSLKSFGDLPATQLDDACYQNMFCNCHLLSIPPKISATKLDNYSCDTMFASCAALNVSLSKTANQFFTCPSTDGLTDPVKDMFAGTKGYTSDPTTGQTFYWVN